MQQIAYISNKVIQSPSIHTTLFLRLLAKNFTSILKKLIDFEDKKVKSRSNYCITRNTAMSWEQTHAPFNFLI